MHDRFLAGRTRRVAADGMALVLALLFSCGCYSHRAYDWPQASVTGPGWKTYNGQAVWKPTKRVPELAGDVFVAVNTNGEATMQFSKTIPMLTAHIDSAHWQIDVPGQKEVYSGHYPPPSHFALLQIPAFLRGEALSRSWRETGGLDGWEIRNPKTGEYLRGYFNLP